MATRSSNWKKASALVPLALLSGAWTVSLAVSNANADSDEAGGKKLPDGSSVPTKAIEAPASVSNPGEIAPGVPTGTANQIVATSTSDSIPAAALAAYQRAAQVIDSADKSCKIDWTLIGAVGRVESNHGRYGGNVLDDNGVSQPGIYGIPLDGTNGTQKINDTDAAQYDKDPIWDRAVGPMQFIPSTWSVVGVDGDGDGKRNPQDIDDSALGTAVYLCSGDDDLSTMAGKRAAVYRYNHSNDYVVLVLRIADAYAAGDYSAVPTSSYAGMTFGQSYDDSVFNVGTQGYHPPKGHNSKPHGKAPNAADPSSTPTEPATPGSGDGNGTNPGGSNVKDPGKTIKDTVDNTTGAVKDTVTELQKATEYCQEQFTAAQLDLIGGLSKCTDAYLKGGVNAVQGLLDALGLGGLLGGLLGKP